jgi:hypothetical protein
MPRWRLMCSQQHYRKNMTIKLSYYNDRIIRYNKKRMGENHGHTNLLIVTNRQACRSDQVIWNNFLGNWYSIQEQHIQKKDRDCKKKTRIPGVPKILP